MKKINVAKIIWVSCVFLSLIIILVMVVDYKVNYQYAGGKKLYFYNCKDNLCVSESKKSDNLIFSSFDCGIETCPKFNGEIGDDYVLLVYDDMSILFNYREGKIVSQGYDSYEFINNDYIIVTKSKLKGIIDLSDRVTVDIVYDDIGYKSGNYLSGFNSSYIIAKKNEKYGIVSFKDGNVIEEFKYDIDKIDELLNIIKKESDINV